MHEEDRLISEAPAAIWHKIMDIGSALIREYEDGVQTAPELAEVVHYQICELARVYHQLKHLHPGKEGEN